MLCILAIYVGSYFVFRTVATRYAPYAWDRPIRTELPAGSIMYPVFGTKGNVQAGGNGHSSFEIAAYYAFCPLVELDLSVNNHPANPLPKWEFFGSNWPK